MTDENPRMTSHRPYLLRALSEWIADNDMTPHLLVAAPPELGNLRPAALDHPTLWNADELFWTTARARERRR